MAHQRMVEARRHAGALALWLDLVEHAEPRTARAKRFLQTFREAVEQALPLAQFVLRQREEDVYGS